MLLLVWSSCKSQIDATSAQNSPEKPFVADQNKSLIVFIHGWGGDDEETWTNFPKFIREDLRLAGYEAISYGYPTSALGHSPRIADITNNFTQWLKNCCSASKQYVFITHSMGGIVAKEFILEMLRTGQSSELKVDRIFLIATPNTGLDLARWAQLVPLISKAQLKEIRGVDEPFLLKQLRDWQTHVEGVRREMPSSLRKWIKAIVIYGTDDKVVSMESAIDRFPYTIAAIDKDRVYDHRNIVKPEKPTDFVVQTVIREILAPLTSGINMGPRDLLLEEETLLNRAEDAFTRGEYRSAVTRLEGLVSKYPNAHFLRYRYGTYLSLIPERREDGAKELKKALEINPGEPYTHFNLAVVLYDMGRLADAEKEALWTYRKDPGHPRAKFLLGRIAYDKGDYETAIGYYDEITKSNSDYSEYGFYYSASTGLKSGTTEKSQIQAIEKIDTALRYAEAQGTDRIEKLAQKICHDANDSNDPLYRIREFKDFQRTLSRYAKYLQGRGCLISQ